jgi:hypothetical protein
MLTVGCWLSALLLLLLLLLVLVSLYSYYRRIAATKPKTAPPPLPPSVRTKRDEEKRIRSRIQHAVRLSATERLGLAAHPSI